MSYDYDNEEAGLHLEIMDTDDDDLFEAGDYDDDDGEWIEIYDEAGFLEFIIPAIAAAEARKRGHKFPLKPGRRPKRRGRSRGHRGGRRKPTSRNYSAQLRSLGVAIRGNSRAIREIRNMLLGRVQGTTLPGSPGEHAGFRPLLGATLALAAPGAPGLAAYGPLIVAPTNVSQVSHLLVDVVEDSAAAAAAGDQVGPATPFLVSGLFIAGSNVIRSAIPAVPGTLFQPTGSHYGYPLGSGRKVDVPASAPISVAGAWNPRRPNGASAADVTAALLSPQVAA